MGAVFTIALFSPLMVVFYILEKVGIDVDAIFNQVTAAIEQWAAENPAAVEKIGEFAKDAIDYIIAFAETIS